MRRQASEMSEGLLWPTLAFHSFILGCALGGFTRQHGTCHLAVRNDLGPGNQVWAQFGEVLEAIIQ